MTVGFTIGFAAVGAASLLDPGLRLSKGPTEKQSIAAANLEPVRIIGIPFVPNVHPRER
jgi:hypothetical protein